MHKFQIDDKIAKIEIVCDGCRVTITVERQDGGKIAEKDAEIALTTAMSSFPTQRISSG
jgi:hypothetical protein